MNRVILNVSLLFCSLLVSCSSASKPLVNTMAASEEVNITSFDCTYNSETSKYDCLVEGVNSTEKYMVLSELKMAANNGNYLPVKTDSPFFTSVLVKPGETFEVAYQTENNVVQSQTNFSPSYILGDVKDISFVKLAHFEYDESSLYRACFYIEFNKDLGRDRYINNVNYYFDYKAINYINYDGTNYCVCSDYVGAQYSETVRIYLNFDQQIDASEISFEDVIIVEKRKTGIFDFWTGENKTNIIRIFKYIALGILCGVIVVTISLITYSVIRKKKQASNK